MKHNARLPRTAGLRTLSELSASFQQAGLDSSKIERRATLIAKARGLGRKRKREEEMYVDDEGQSGGEEEGEGEGEGGDDWMDVDGKEEGDERSPQKRRKGSTGTAVISRGKHSPRTNRQTAGLRDHAQVSKAVKLRNFGQRERNMHARAGESDRAIKVKMVSFHDCTERGRGDLQRRLLITIVCSQSTCFLANEKRERPRDGEGVRPHSLSAPRLQIFSFPVVTACTPVCCSRFFPCSLVSRAHASPVGLRRRIYSPGRFVKVSSTISVYVAPITRFAQIKGVIDMCIYMLCGHTSGIY